VRLEFFYKNLEDLKKFGGKYRSTQIEMGSRQDDDRMEVEEPDLRQRRDEEEDSEEEENAGEKKGAKMVRKEPNPHEGKLKFRNYVPRDALLRELKMEAAPLPSMVGEINRKLVLLEGKTNDELLALAPKKPNWDLKRDIEKKLEALEKRTQRAIVLLLKQKLEGREGASVEGKERTMMLEQVQQEGDPALSQID